MVQVWQAVRDLFQRLQLILAEIQNTDLRQLDQPIQRSQAAVDEGQMAELAEVVVAESDDFFCLVVVKQELLDFGGRASLQLVLNVGLHWVLGAHCGIRDDWRRNKLKDRKD